MNEKRAIRIVPGHEPIERFALAACAFKPPTLGNIEAKEQHSSHFALLDDLGSAIFVPATVRVSISYRAGSPVRRTRSKFFSRALVRLRRQVQLVERKAHIALQCVGWKRGAGAVHIDHMQIAIKGGNQAGDAVEDGKLAASQNRGWFDFVDESGHYPAAPTRRASQKQFRQRQTGTDHYASPRCNAD